MNNQNQGPNQDSLQSRPSNRIELDEEGRIPFLKDFKFPYKKEPGREYWYLANGKIKKAVLKKFRIDFTYHPELFDEKHHVRFYLNFKMDNQDTPNKLFDTKDDLYYDLEQNIID
jgi:hypothetical protein